MLLVVGAELVEALPGDAVRRRSSRPRPCGPPWRRSPRRSAAGWRAPRPPIDVEDCLEVVTGGPITVLVPLLGGETVHALVGVPARRRSPAARRPRPPAAPASRDRGASAAAGSWGIDMLRDVEMEVTCELGRTRMTVRQLLALAPGDVVELDRLAGSPADLLVNGTLLARGEVVVVDE